METICSQAGDGLLWGAACFVYNFQTLLAGGAAILVAISAGIPVWRQLKDSNLQTRISHRETLANLLRDALQRFDKVDQSIKEPLSAALRVSSDPSGAPLVIGTDDAHHLEMMFSGVLDWYLEVLSGTEHPSIEARKTELKAALDGLTETLSDAHSADHNDQVDEDHSFTDEEWAAILADCADAKVKAAERVETVEAVYGRLRDAQEVWLRTLRTRLATLDLQIAAHH